MPPAVQVQNGSTSNRISQQAGLLRRYGLWAVLAIVIIGLMIASPTFRQHVNSQDILEQNSIIGIVALAMAVMMITGGFDLSVGAVGATSSVVGAVVYTTFGTLPAV